MACASHPEARVAGRCGRCGADACESCLVLVGGESCCLRCEEEALVEEQYKTTHAPMGPEVFVGAIVLAVAAVVVYAIWQANRAYQRFQHQQQQMMRQWQAPAAALQGPVTNLLAGKAALALYFAERGSYPGRGNAALAQDLAQPMQTLPPNVPRNISQNLVAVIPSLNATGVRMGALPQPYLSAWLQAQVALQSLPQGIPATYLDVARAIAPSTFQDPSTGELLDDYGQPLVWGGPDASFYEGYDLYSIGRDGVDDGGGGDDER